VVRGVVQWSLLVKVVMDLWVPWKYLSLHSVAAATRFYWVAVLNSKEIHVCMMPYCYLTFPFHCQNTTNKYVYRYINLLHYKQRSLLHVSSTCCGHHQCIIITWSWIISNSFPPLINHWPSVYFWRNLIILYIFYAPLKAQFVRDFPFNYWIEV
jgi:hypothetical protein